MPNGRTKTKYSDWSGEELRKHRSLAGMTQGVMAEHLGMSHRMYCYYESGKTPINKPLQLAVQYMVDSPQKEVEKPQGTLTDFEKERVMRLLHAIENHPLDDLGERTQKILRQIPQEMALLLSKL